MSRFIIILGVSILGLIGCVNEVVTMADGYEGDDEGLKNTDTHGLLLDKPNSKAALLGDTKIFTPGIPPVGAIQFSQDFSWITTSADSLANTQLVTITFDGFPLDSSVTDDADFAIWQLVFNFGTGNSFSGGGDVTIGGFGPIKDENIVDIGLGTSICIPTAFTTMKVRVTGFNGAGFPGTHRMAASERVSIALGYGNKTHSQRPTKTEFWGKNVAAPFASSPEVIANNGQTVFTRPKYANAVQFTWSEYIGSTPCRVDFASPEGAILTSMTLTGNITPPPIIAWPESCIYAVITNLTGGNIRDIRAQNYLTL